MNYRHSFVQGTFLGTFSSIDNAQKCMKIGSLRRGSRSFDLTFRPLDDLVDRSEDVVFVRDALEFENS